jgi:toxin ParE1/3/4
MSLRVTILDPVREDLRETTAYLKKQFGEEAAKRRYREARASIKALGQHPHIGTTIPELEEIQLPNFKQHIPNQSYRIIYELKPDEIVVHICCSTRRDFQSLLFKRLMKA